MLTPINPPPAINTSGRMISRRVKLAADELVTVFNVDLDDDTAWTIGYQESGIGVGTAKISYRRNLVTLKQEISFGKNGGDFITGLGSFEFQLQTNPVGGCEVETFWTLQPKVIDVGLFTDARQSVNTGTLSELGSFGGFIPFPFNAVSLFTEAASFTLELQDISGNVLQAPMTITPPNTYVLALQIPPEARLFVEQTSGSAKTFTPVYSRI